MEAFKHIINLDNAETVEEMDQEMLAAHEAVNNLHLEKLKELKNEVDRRLGVQAYGAVGPMSPMGTQRPTRDNPQA